jgi:hypothetical protein
MDNFGVHRPRRVGQWTEDSTSELIYLPPSFSASQTGRGSFLEDNARPQEGVGARTAEVLIEAMSGALAAVSAEDVRAFFVHYGYPRADALIMKGAVRVVGGVAGAFCYAESLLKVIFREAPPLEPNALLEWMFSG